jgi:hypothetical protein
VLGDGRDHGLVLQLAEHRLAVLDEDVGDRLARDGLDTGVGVDEVDAEPASQQLADGGLARAGRPDQDRGRRSRSGRGPLPLLRCLPIGH